VKVLWVPVHRRLGEVLAQMRRAGVHVVTNTRGPPWTVMGFKASWSCELNREVMQSMRERRLVLHGLRKSAVVTLLDAGATDAEVSAITGQTREMVAHYSRQVNQRRLAAAAILKWEAAIIAKWRPARRRMNEQRTGLHNRSWILAKPRTWRRSK
jgi:hypothetical protein